MSDLDRKGGARVGLHTAISICTGVGMLDHGVGLALGGTIEPVLYVEREAFASANLAWQMETGILAPARIWSDARNMSHPVARRYVEARLDGRGLDLFIGGIPCQPWSCAGRRRGHDDERDLWGCAVEAIEAYRPGVVFIENVPGIATANIVQRRDGLRRIVEDLGELGFRATPGFFGSEEAGASHGRLRCFVLGLADGDRVKRRMSQIGDRDEGQKPTTNKAENRSTILADLPRYAPGRPHVAERGGELGDAHGAGLEGRQGRRRNAGPERSPTKRNGHELPRYAPGRTDYRSWAAVARLDPARMPCIERQVRGMANGLASPTDQLRAVGNGVDPMVAALAFVSLWAAVKAGIILPEPANESGNR